MDSHSAVCVGRYLCVAVVAFEVVLHQAETDIDYSTDGHEHDI